MHADFLSELTRQVRDHTVRLFEAAPEAWLFWAPDGTSNHILWHAGHAVWLQDELCVRPITGKRELPAAWAGSFGAGCRSVATNTDWPSRREVHQRLVDQRQRMLELIDQLPPDRLRIPEPPPTRGWDLVRGIIHGLHDEARHHGEMYLLWKMCRTRGPRN